MARHPTLVVLGSKPRLGLSVSQILKMAEAGDGKTSECQPKNAKAKRRRAGKPPK